MSHKPRRTVSSSRLMRALIRNPEILKAGPATLLFLLSYFRKFRVRDAGGNLVLHSHLPPLAGRAYQRFIREHLLDRRDGPSHAQVGVTADCPQNCVYCYNKSRRGSPMDTELLLKVIEDLRTMGVFWLGFTGGEPLLRTDLETITEAAAPECAVKLFTTGWGLTRERARDLKQAGLFSASVSLDHRDPTVHDRARRTSGAHASALRALEIFHRAGIHVGVSAVLAGNMLEAEEAAGFLEWLEGLGIDEAWLSETKPNLSDKGRTEVIREDQRLRLVALQDRWNRRGGMTVNYLGHFEGREHFGCNAGIRMVYVDAFGEVSPCVFTPMSFGNVRRAPLAEIYRSMRKHFAPGSDCFINRNYSRLRQFSGKSGFLDASRVEAAMDQIRFGPPGRFFRLIGNPPPRKRRETC